MAGTEERTNQLEAYYQQQASCGGRKEGELDDLIIRDLFDEGTYRLRLVECRSEIAARKIEL